LKQVFLTLKANTLFAKQSKCFFIVNRVEYLGHFIYKDGVSMDPAKIEAMLNWPIPQKNQTIEGILGVSDECVFLPSFSV